MEFRDRALATLSCPLDWTWLQGDMGADPTANAAAVDWLYCCQSFAVPVDESIVINGYASDFAILDPNDIGRSEAINLETMRPNAERLYDERIGRIYRLPFLRPSDQGKHYLAGHPKESVIKRSKSGISYFYKNHYPNALRWAFWSWLIDYYDTLYMVENAIGMGELDAYEMVIEGRDCINECRRQTWLSLLSGATGRIAFDTRHEIGASNGESATCVCFDISSTNIHAYPVSESLGQSFMAPDELWISKTLW